jgi:hypothetical protein
VGELTNGRTRFAAIKWARDLPTMLHRGRIDRVGHHVVLVAATFARNDGTDIWVSLDTLAACSHLELRELAAVLDRLETLGLMRREMSSKGIQGWALNLSAERAEVDEMDARAERRRSRTRDRMRRLRERRQSESDAGVDRHVTPKSTVTGQDVTQESDAVTHKSDAGDATRSVTLAGQGGCNSLELPELPKSSVPTERANADASPGDEVEISTPTEASEDGLFGVESKPAKASRKRSKKSVSPEAQERERQAQELASRYYEEKRKMASFPGVKQIILRALANYEYRIVSAAVDRMLNEDRSRAFTLPTFGDALERVSGARQGSRGPRDLSTGDRRWVQMEMLKDAPNWDLLARMGVTPQNAHEFTRQTA